MSTFTDPRRALSALPQRGEEGSASGLQLLTVVLEEITAGDYLAWVWDPEPPALGRDLRSVSVEADPVGEGVELELVWDREPPTPWAAVAAAGFPLTPEVVAVRDRWHRTDKREETDVHDSHIQIALVQARVDDLHRALPVGPTSARWAPPIPQCRSRSVRYESSSLAGSLAGVPFAHIPDQRKTRKEPIEMSVYQATIRPPSRLAAALEGKIVLPEHGRFDEARQAWNLAIDQRPAAVVFPESADDVQAAVLFAREHGLRIAAQGTGHNAGPLGSLDDTILIKTERMREVRIDPGRRIARVGAGVLWLEAVEAAAAYGLAGLQGSSPDVGVVGYTLGGGLSFMGRKHGLAANRVHAIEMVRRAAAPRRP